MAPPFLFFAAWVKMFISFSFSLVFHGLNVIFLVFVGKIDILPVNVSMSYKTKLIWAQVCAQELKRHPGTIGEHLPVKCVHGRPFLFLLPLSKDGLHVFICIKWMNPGRHLTGLCSNGLVRNFRPCRRCIEVARVCSCSKRKQSRAYVSLLSTTTIKSVCDFSGSIYCTLFIYSV